MNNKKEGIDQIKGEEIKIISFSIMFPLMKSMAALVRLVLLLNSRLMIHPALTLPLKHHLIILSGPIIAPIASLWLLLIAQTTMGLTNFPKS